MVQHLCKTCGGVLETAAEAGKWICKYCGNVFEDENVKRESESMLELLNEQKIEQVANLRRNLYDAINARFTDSGEICRICAEIKKHLPDDFMANFYYTVNHGNMQDITNAIMAIDVESESENIDGIVRFLIKMLTRDLALPLMNLIERAYKDIDLSKYENFATEISEELSKVDRGLYETLIPRDVFVAYSSKDMNKVIELVSLLESNNISCFVAARNLRHGRGAVENYQNALREAMDNCKVVVFVSSLASRNMGCDALKIELPYIKQRDIENAPFEFKQNYSAMPERYKKPRVEYRIQQSTHFNVADTVVKEFFDGYEFAYSPSEVAQRVVKHLSELYNKAYSSAEKEKPAADNRYSNNNYNQPNNGYNQPNNYNRPNNGYNQPNNGYNQPNNGYNRPNNGYNQPNNGYNQPNNGYNQPNNGYNQPNNGYNQPNNGYNQPNNGYNQPNNGYNQPNNGYNQPNNGYNQPSQQKKSPEFDKRGVRIESPEDYGKRRAKGVKAFRWVGFFQLLFCLVAGVAFTFSKMFEGEVGNDFSSLMYNTFIYSVVFWLIIYLPLRFFSKGLIHRVQGKGRIRGAIAKFCSYSGVFIFGILAVGEAFAMGGQMSEYSSGVTFAAMAFIYLLNIIAIKTSARKK